MECIGIKFQGRRKILRRGTNPMNYLSAYKMSFFRRISRVVLLFMLFLLTIPYNASVQAQLLEEDQSIINTPPFGWIGQVRFSVTYEYQHEPAAHEQTAWIEVSGEGEFGPIGHEIQDLTIGPSGALWVATNSGLSRFSEGKFRHFTRKNGMPHDQILTVVAAGRGILAGTREGLVWFDDLASFEDISPVPIDTQGAVNSIFEFQNKFLFLITPLDGDSKIGSITFNQNGVPGTTNRSLYRFDTLVRRMLPGGRSWLLCQNQKQHWKIGRLPNDSTHKSDPLILEDFRNISPVDVKRIGDEILMLTEDEVRLYSKDIASPQSSLMLLNFDEKDSQSFWDNTGDGSQIWLGRQNNLWLINPVNGAKLKYLKLLSGTQPQAIAEEPNGRLWVGTKKNGLLLAVPDKGIGWNLPSVRASVKFRYDGPLMERRPERPRQ